MATKKGKSRTAAANAARRKQGPTKQTDYKRGRPVTAAAKKKAGGKSKGQSGGSTTSPGAAKAAHTKKVRGAVADALGGQKGRISKYSLTGGEAAKSMYDPKTKRINTQGYSSGRSRKISTQLKQAGIKFKRGGSGHNRYIEVMD